jgi:hypothetical protein
MAGSRIPGSMGRQLLLNSRPSRTPGPLGINDAADPNVEAIRGDTPGTLGVNDGADPNTVLVVSSHPPRRSSPPPPLAMVVVSVDNYHSLYIAKSTSAVTRVKEPKIWMSDPQQLVYQYDLDLSDVTCLYIAAWADRTGRQGLLVEIRDWFKEQILSGDPEWKVFPTKDPKFHNVHPGPPTDVSVQENIKKASWTSPVVGPDNSGVDRTFRRVLQCDDCACWTWYGSGDRPKRTAKDDLPPFKPAHDHGEYLLFRVCAPEQRISPHRARFDTGH